jgi:two-component system, NtrC family, response regulator HupR/HoxA
MSAESQSNVATVPKPRVVFVDDEKDLAETLADQYSDLYKTSAFDSPSEALKAIDDSVAVVVADHRMPGMTGVQLLTKLRSKTPDTVRILLSAWADIAALRESINDAHIFHFVAKEPTKAAQAHLRTVIADAVKLYALRLETRHQHRQLQSENARLRKQVGERAGKAAYFTDLLGDDPELLTAIKIGKQVADTDFPVLITGETGTGKEIMARAIHYEGKRSHHRFWSENCALFHRDLAQSRLFGQTKGAFTGADVATKGILRDADRGTLFLDEIGEMPEEVQAFLLRFLDHGEIRPVGDTTSAELNADVRIIAATNRRLTIEVEHKRFRLDLYERLCTVEIFLPPLRQRRNDIPLLARFAMQTTSNRLGWEEFSITEGALAFLKSLEYPGNIRELNRIIARSMLLGNDGNTIDLAHVRNAVGSDAQVVATDHKLYSVAVKAAKKEIVQRTLRRNRYRRDLSATELGMSVRNLSKLIKQLEIEEEG